MHNKEEFKSILSLLLHNAITQAVSDPSCLWGREVVEFLVSRGADVNVKDYDYPLLSLAVMGGRLDVAGILLSNGADVNGTQDDESTALHCAVELENEIALEITKYLLDAGATVDKKSRDGRTPLHCVKFKETADLLMRNGANVNSKDKYGETPLHSAAKTGRKSVVEFLIDKGAKINSKDLTGRTPLHWAVEFCSESVQWFITGGASLNAVDGLRKTPLDLAAKNSRIYQILKRHRALHYSELSDY